MSENKKHKLIIEETNSPDKNEDICNINLESEYKNSCVENKLTKNCNKFLLKKELFERKCLQTLPEEEHS